MGRLPRFAVLLLAVLALLLSSLAPGLVAAPATAAPDAAPDAEARATAYTLEYADIVGQGSTGQVNVEAHGPDAFDGTLVAVGTFKVTTYKTKRTKKGKKVRRKVVTTYSTNRVSVPYAGGIYGFTPDAKARAVLKKKLAVPGVVTFTWKPRTGAAVKRTIAVHFVHGPTPQRACAATRLPNANAGNGVYVDDQELTGSLTCAAAQAFAQRWTDCAFGPTLTGRCTRTIPGWSCHSSAWVEEDDFDGDVVAVHASADCFRGTSRYSFDATASPKPEEQTCATPETYPYAGGAYDSLVVAGAACSTGENVADAWIECSVETGPSGRCTETVEFGWACTEVRTDESGTLEIDTTCSYGSSRVKFTHHRPATPAP